MTTPRLLVVLLAAMAATVGATRAWRSPAVPSSAARVAGETASPVHMRLKTGDALPAFSLIAQDGRRFSDTDLRGRVTAVTFVFTRCPMPEFCPLVSKRFQQMQREVEQDPALRAVQLLSVTLDPAFDTPPVLDAYATSLGAHRGRWHFVTGEQTEITRLASALAIHVDRTGVLLDHTLATAIVDGNGRLVEIWRGNGWTVTELVGVLRREASTMTASGGE